MTKALNQTKGMPAPDAKVLQDIQRVGWHVVSVFSSEGEEGPEWAFSLGVFHSFGHPEIMISGLPLDTCTAIINEIGTTVRAGKRYESGEQYADILADSYKCAFREVRRRYYRDYVGYGLWFYERDPFPLLQCFWPDKRGRFPWNDGCSEYVRSVQPLLFIE